MATWIFQANPDIFDIDAYLTIADRITWTVRQERLAPQMRPGDEVYVWRAKGKKRGPSGLIARAVLASAPEVQAEDVAALPFWRVKQRERELRVWLHVSDIRTKEAMLRRETVIADPVLSGMRLLTLANETNFLLTNEQTARIEHLWSGTTNGPGSVGSRKASNTLRVGQLYTRTQLQQQFGIVDATIRTGVYRPRGYDSVWLFVTEEKTADRTQYSDSLRGDDLYWDGQTSGRTDSLVINHEREGLELLIFYRQRKDQFPEYAFQYEGPFRYVSHHGGRPAHFHIRRTTADDAALEGAEVERALADALDRPRRRAAGQGWGLSPAARRVVEQRAMDLAKAHFSALGYQIDDVSESRPFDLLCRRGEEEVRVEVKGTTSLGESLQLTRNEVEHARLNAQKMVLFVAHSIVASNDERPIAQGGITQLWSPWNVDDGELTSRVFTYKPSKQTIRDKP